MIIALAGRRIDAKDAEVNRFPLSKTSTVRRRLVKALKELGCQMLISSGACGADLLALSVASSLGINRLMVLPFNPAEFRSISVVDRPGQWGSVFDKIYADILSQHCVSQLNLDPDDPTTFASTNEVIIMKAIELAKQDSKVIKSISAMLVWDGKSYGQEDTTNLFRQQALSHGLSIHEVLTL